MSRKIRILFILDQFPGPTAGTEGQFWLLLQNLDRNRFEPSILLLRPSRFLESTASGVSIKVLGILKLRSPRSLWRILTATVWAAQSKYDVAHIFFNDSSLVFPLLLKLVGIKVIVSRRDLGFWHTPGQLRILRWNRRFVDGIVANCKAVKKAVCESERYDPSRVHVIYNGLVRRMPLLDRATARRSLTIPLDAKVLTIVANLRPLKRIDDAIRALALVRKRNPSAILLIVGEDRPFEGGKSLRKELESLATSLGVYEAVRFLGALPDPMPSVVSADVCLLVSETEGLSNAIMEYMLAARPVVCTDVGGNAELISESETGNLIAVGDVDRLADSTVALLRNAGQASAYGTAAQRRAIELFAPIAMVDRHMELYATLASSLRHAA
jgi:glycosyltransferase involved in cell wall biosynthesis